MDNHNVFLIMIVVIIVIFVLLLLAGYALSTETFKNEIFKNETINLIPLRQRDSNNSKNKVQRNGKKHIFIDTIVPQSLKFKSEDNIYKDDMKGTSLINISAIDTSRYPIAIETSTNWYNTQGLLLKNNHIGVNDGKLPKSDCHCSNRDLLLS